MSRQWRIPWRSEPDDALAAELDSYLEIATAANIARGLDPQSARAAAIRKLGNRARIREEIYEMNTIGLIDSLLREMRHALRLIRRDPGFSVIAVLTLAIGVGATTAIFSVVNGVLIKPLRYRDPERLIVIHHSLRRDSTTRTLDFTPSMYFTFGDETRTFQDLGIWVERSVSVTGTGDPEEVSSLGITNGVLAALGIEPLLGRRFSPADDNTGNAETVMLTWGYWKRHFGADPAVIGRTLNIDSRPRQIIGVLPRDFDFLGKNRQVVLPLALQRSGAGLLDDFSYKGIARIKPGTTISQADADMRRMIAIWLRSWNAPPAVVRTLQEGGIAPVLVPLRQEVVGDIATTLWILMGGIGLVLLIACANVATLLLTRTESRQRELAIRAALGAGSGRIARELMVESSVLALSGGALGLLMAFVALRLLPSIAPENLPRIGEISADPAALAFALFASLLASLVVGVVPVLRHAGRINPALHAGHRSATDSRERGHVSAKGAVLRRPTPKELSRAAAQTRPVLREFPVRNVLVVMQVAGSLVLLIASGLMIRTMIALNRVNPGFARPEQIQMVRVSMPHDQMPENQPVFANQKRMLDRIASIPGVSAAAFLTGPPLSPARMPATSFFDAAKAYTPGEIGSIYRLNFVSPGALNALGTRLIAGRDFTWTELSENRAVALVSAGIAREKWGSANAALGRRLRQGPRGNDREIIGVVEDVYFNGVQEAPPLVVYWPLVMEGNFLQGIWRSPSFMVRSPRAGSEGLLAELRQTIWSVNRNVPLFELRTGKEAWDTSLARTSFTLVLLSLAAAMALLLGLIGIYGVIAHSVVYRRREIGIRLALGARPGTVQWMFLVRGLRIVCIGIAAGLAVALTLSRLMSSLLFGVTSLDPATWALTAAALLFVALTACYIPARRAIAVDPAITLRSE